MDSSGVTISVCMASFNGEKFIAEQILSILEQLGENDELIISDDSSTDSTPQIIEQLQQNDSRIIFLPRNLFHNPVYNFENALKICRGEYIFLADQDDIWLPGKVDKVISLLKIHLLVTHDSTVINDLKQILLSSFFAHRKSTAGFWRNLYKNSYTGCCMAFKKSLLDTALPFPRKLQFHDQWLGLLAEAKGKTIFLQEQLILFRRHDNNVSPGINRSSNSPFRKLINRLILFKQLFTRLILNH